MPGEPWVDLAQRVEAVDELIQALFDDAQRCKQAQEIGSARDALLDLRLPLQAALALQAKITTTSFCSYCPLCHAQGQARSGTRMVGDRDPVCPGVTDAVAPS
ncbi:MAG: hypothetical protein ACHQAV_02205 [Solirubrobacterales bacterium]